MMKGLLNKIAVREIELYRYRKGRI
jgi:hypothetical protein